MDEKIEERLDRIEQKIDEILLMLTGEDEDDFDEDDEFGDGR